MKTDTTQRRRSTALMNHSIRKDSKMRETISLDSRNAGALVLILALGMFVSSAMANDTWTVEETWTSDDYCVDNDGSVWSYPFSSDPTHYDALSTSGDDLAAKLQNNLWIFTMPLYFGIQ